jgi:hypothetical protein
MRFGLPGGAVGSDVQSASCASVAPICRNASPRPCARLFVGPFWRDSCA